MNPKCPYCNEAGFASSYLPDTFFNNKLFQYLKCKKCKLLFIYPFPQADDFIVMYPPSYQNGINFDIINDPLSIESKKISSYGRNFELIQKFSTGKKLLDYGCGAANFLLNALHNGFECDGVEYNPEHVAVMKNEIPNSNFYTISDFLQNNTIKYDVIRLSNVLEHLTNPSEIIDQLKSKLNADGILLIEGPVETNPTFALRIRQLYFKTSKLLRKNRKVNHPPTHIIFANANNQRAFFKKMNLTELNFELWETAWPFPQQKSEITGIGSAIKFLIAKISIALKPLNKNWGNTFIYIGKLH